MTTCSLLLLVCMAAVVAGQATVSVIGPADLIASQFPKAQYPQGIPNHPALFGISNYGNPLFCRLVIAPGDGLGCTDFTLPPFPDGNTMVLIDRGGPNCTFMAKVRRAQRAGAAVAVIVDTADSYYLPWMKDDRSEDDIVIPSMIISHAEGQKLKDANAAGTMVTMLAVFSIHRPDDRVEWDFFTSADDSRQFKLDFAEAALALGQSTLMTLYVRTVSKQAIGCDADPNKCTGNCINNGRYCLDSVTQVPGLKGQPVVMENLRQACIISYLNSTTPSQTAYWNYVKAFYTSCWPGFSADCSFTQMRAVGIDVGAINTCVGDINADVANPVLDASRKGFSDKGPFYLPTFYINTYVPVIGQQRCPAPIKPSSCSLLKALCAGFANAPAACAETACGLGVPVDRCGVCRGNDECIQSHSGLSTGMVVLIVILVLVVVGVIAVFFSRRQTQRMRADFDNILRQYLTLDEANKFSHSGGQDVGRFSLAAEADPSLPAESTDEIIFPPISDQELNDTIRGHEYSSSSEHSNLLK